MPTFRRWIVAVAALLSGAAVATGLVAYTSTSGAGTEVYVVAHDLPAGSPVAIEQLRLEKVRLGGAARAAFGRGSERELERRRAAHDLSAGQLLQRSDLLPVSNGGDRRLVMLPIKEMPPVAAGDRIDLLLVTGTSDRTGVTPFASGLEVVTTTPGGVVVAVSARQAAALVYGSVAARLIAVAAPGGGGEEAPVASLQQALSALGTKR
jgi:hypothetical protein